MVEQSFIVACGIASIWMSQSPDVSGRRWAPIIGLIAQPFWMWASWKADQFGIFALSFIYAAGWIRGVRTYWGRPV